MTGKSRGAKARQMRSMLAAGARDRVRELIRQRVFEEFCSCGKCLRGDYSNLCLSAREIAGTCNALKVPTTTGKIGTWQVTTVTRLFKQTDKV
jgi:hypothetical protein